MTPKSVYTLKVSTKVQKEKKTRSRPMTVKHNKHKKWERGEERMPWF
jgi:hypothetical protein